MHAKEQRIGLDGLDNSQLFDLIVPRLDYDERVLFTRDINLKSKADIVFGFGRQEVIDEIIARTQLGHPQNLNRETDLESSHSSSCSTDDLTEAEKPSSLRGRGNSQPYPMARSRIVSCVMAGVNTSTSISERTGIPPRTVRRRLKSLVDEGILFRRGSRMLATYHLDERGQRP